MTWRSILQFQTHNIKSNWWIRTIPSISMSIISHEIPIIYIYRYIMHNPVKHDKFEVYWSCINRRKFRSQTSDNMDRWKAKQGRGREKRKIRREKSRRERVRRKKMQMREKVGKSRNTVFFQWFVAPEDRKVGSLKRRVRSQLARWEMNKCTPLWREAHFQVKMYKTHQVRTTFGSWDVEKVARRTFASEKAKHTSRSDHFWKLRCRKSARRCGAKHVSKSKCTKHTRFGPLLEVEMSKKVHAIVARRTFASEKAKNTSRSDHFWKLRCRKSARRCGTKHVSKSKCTKHHMRAPLLEVQMPFRVAGARDCAPSQKWAKREGFVAIAKNDGRRGTFEEDLQRCIFCGQAQYKRHLHRSCSEVRALISWERLHFGASDL